MAIWIPQPDAFRGRSNTLRSELGIFVRLGAPGFTCHHSQVVQKIGWKIRMVVPVPPVKDKMTGWKIQP